VKDLHACLLEIHMVGFLDREIRSKSQAGGSCHFLRSSASLRTPLREASIDIPRFVGDDDIGRKLSFGCDENIYVLQPSSDVHINGFPVLSQRLESPLAFCCVEEETWLGVKEPEVAIEQPALSSLTAIELGDCLR
jgi:hypothetical protein